MEEILNTILDTLKNLIHTLQLERKSLEENTPIKLPEIEEKKQMFSKNLEQLTTSLNTLLTNHDLPETKEGIQLFIKNHISPNDQGKLNKKFSIMQNALKKMQQYNNANGVIINARLTQVNRRLEILSGNIHKTQLTYGANGKAKLTQNHKYVRKT